MRDREIPAIVPHVPLPQAILSVVRRVVGNSSAAGRPAACPPWTCRSLPHRAAAAWRRRRRVRVALRSGLTPERAATERRPRWRWERRQWERRRCARWEWCCRRYRQSRYRWCPVSATARSTRRMASRRRAGRGCRHLLRRRSGGDGPPTASLRPSRRPSRRRSRHLGRHLGRRPRHGGAALRPTARAAAATAAAALKPLLRRLRSRR